LVGVVVRRDDPFDEQVLVGPHLVGLRELDQELLQRLLRREVRQGDDRRPEDQRARRAGVVVLEVAGQRAGLVGRPTHVDGELDRLTRRGAVVVLADADVRDAPADGDRQVTAVVDGLRAGDPVAQRDAVLRGVAGTVGEVAREHGRGLARGERREHREGGEDVAHDGLSWIVTGATAPASGWFSFRGTATRPGRVFAATAEKPGDGREYAPPRSRPVSGPREPSG